MNRLQRDLERRAKQFAGEVADLLNGAVTDGIRLDCGLYTHGSHGQAVVTYKLDRVNRRGEPIPLKIARSPAQLSLRVFHALRMDVENRHLASTKSTYGLYVQHKSAFAYHYERDPNNDYPAAHMHIDGRAKRLQRVLDVAGRGKDTPTALHFPVGGRWYRPSLEDIIEFCIVERLVHAREGWRHLLRESRERKHEQQFRAAVRDNPGLAADVLTSLGWTAHT
ncbi:MAG: hypothetical protein OXH86_15860 [Acidimicrobiaceae bacterium]|nr:hypothetical protein [Acidimicrobiaceae bacterium]MDE0498825.1 hypothetical protein [Acidimicrobiaceae bacterium]